MSQLRHVLETAQRRLAQLVQEEAALKAKLADTQKEKSQAKAALERVELLSSGKRNLLVDDCIECFVFHGRDSKMTPVPSDTEYDLFRCRVCGHEFEVRP